MERDPDLVTRRKHELECSRRKVCDDLCGLPPTKWPDALAGADDASKVYVLEELLKSAAFYPELNPPPDSFRADVDEEYDAIRRKHKCLGRDEDGFEEPDHDDSDDSQGEEDNEEIDNEEDESDDDEEDTEQSEEGSEHSKAETQDQSAAAPIKLIRQNARSFQPSQESKSPDFSGVGGAGP